MARNDSQTSGLFLQNVRTDLTGINLNSPEAARRMQRVTTTVDGNNRTGVGRRVRSSSTATGLSISEQVRREGEGIGGVQRSSAADLINPNTGEIG